MEIYFGMTSAGGLSNSGVIFKIRNDGTGFTKLFDFTGTSGSRPNGSLVIREDNFSPAATTTLTLKSEPELSVSIHPNPSTDNFNIHVKSPATEAIKVMISDQYGQLITTYDIKPDTPMQIGSELKRGLYIMKVIQGRAISMQRMVKK